MSRTNILILLVMLVILVVASYFAYTSLYQNKDAKDSEANKSLVGNKKGGEEALGYKDLEGNDINLENYEGKIRIVNSWATWTPFSVDELKALNILAGELSSEEGVVIAINRAEPPAKIKAYLNKVGPFDNIIFIEDSSDNFYHSVEGFAMPETVFYDSAGHMVFHQHGKMSLDKMREQLDKIKVQQ